MITHAPSDYIVIDLDFKEIVEDYILFIESTAYLTAVNPYNNDILLEEYVNQNLAKCNYIGYQDKDGNKVYEGDVFRLGFAHIIGVVVYDSANASYYIRSLKTKVDYILRDFIEDGAKIGNIYLNPELMEIK